MPRPFIKACQFQQTESLYKMNPLNCILIIIALFVSNLAQASEQSSNIDNTGNNSLNFDSQIIDIFKEAIEHPKLLPFSTEAGSSDKKVVLKTILQKFIDHQMYLKNVVYRTDTNVIRVTWGDLHNDYVAKAAYKAGKDKVLSNSLYADKQGVYDIKIMYRKANSEYDYIQLENLKFIVLTQNGTPINQDKYSDGYSVAYKLSNEKCGFCHILAKNDGSPSGLFFPRYQEGQGSNGLDGMSAFFDPSKLKLKNRADTVALGLPAMQDDFYYYRAGLMNNDDQKILRTLVELPQLLEVLARDNRKSYCLLIDTGEVGEKIGLGRDDYICADNVAQNLYVKMTNSSIFNKKDPLIYTVPYFKK